MSPEETTPFMQEQIRIHMIGNRAEYAPSESSRDIVSGKSFTGIIGPFGTGKTTITEEVLRTAPEIQAINTTTTRARKYSEDDKDPEGFRTADEGVTFLTFRDAMADGALINYSVIPGGDIYGTFPEDFPGTHSIGPLLPTSVEQLIKADFKETHFVYIVLAGDLWRRFIEKSRSNMNPKTFQSRVDESLWSINYALNHTDILKFVENTEGEAGLKNAAQKIANLALSRSDESLAKDDAIEYLHQMRSAARNLSKGE